MFSMDEQLFTCVGHDSFNELTLSKKLEDERIQQNLIESFDKIQLQETHNAFINCEEYISLILHNQNVTNMNEKNLNDINLMRKYFHQWRNSVLNKDIELKKSPPNRLQMIDDFFDNILKNKNELNDKKKDVKTKCSEKMTDGFAASNNSLKKKEKSNIESFHHRFQAQKNIIALQKMKLNQQERIIEELKLKKYVEDVGATSDIVSEVRKTLQNCERALKPKLKCIAGEEEKNLEDYDVITPYCTKVPKFIQKMEQRARQREEKRAIVRERRRQIELERQRAKEQMELEKQIMDQDEKNRRLNEYKEKRKQEQLIAIRRKEFSDKMRALKILAELHYEKKLMAKYGISAFQKYLIKIKQDYKIAAAHCQYKIVKNHFTAWNKYTTTTVSKRIGTADNLYKTKMWKCVFQQLKMEHRTMVKKRQVAEDWYEFHVTERLFLLWRHNTRRIKYQRKKQWNLAVSHYNIQLLWKVIGYWQTLPTINKLEREHESRKQKWRLKVQQVLPDFIPRTIDEIDDTIYIQD